MNLGLLHGIRDQRVAHNRGEPDVPRAARGLSATAEIKTTCSFFLDVFS
jgi:hypothetical protein